MWRYRAIPIMLARKSGTDYNRLIASLSSLGYENITDLVSEIAISNVSWHDLLLDTGGEWLLVIDTEGLDWNLLLDFDLSAHHPCALYLETGPSDKWNSIVIEKFQNAGYCFIPLHNNAVFLDSSIKDLTTER